VAIIRTSSAVARPNGFVYNILTCQDVVDKSVSGLYERICLRFVLDMSDLS